MNGIIEAGSKELITETNDTNIVVEFLHGLLKYFILWFKLFITSFNNSDKLEFLIFFYLGYMGGIALLRVTDILERGRIAGVILLILLGYPLFIVSITASDPGFFGSFVAFIILIVLNLLQIKHISYTDLLLIFPLFSKVRLSNNNAENTTEPPVVYNTEKQLKNYLDKVFTEAEKVTQERIKKEKEKEGIQQKIDKKIEEVIKKLEDF